MEKSSFFNSVGGDRVYKAEEWAEYFASFIGNGVFPVPSNGLQVEANSSAGVVIRAGRAWINGYFYFNTDDLNVKLNTADGVLNRIDRIVIRWDLTDRTISAEVKSSAPSNNPTTPALQRDADAYELCIADVYVRAGSTAVLQSDITDQRYNSGLCGVVKGTVDQIDASTLAKQFNDYAELFKQETKLDFEAWFEEIRGILSEDLAGSLALAIDDINQSKGKPGGIATLDDGGKLVQMPTAEDVAAIPLSQKGIANGIATLNGSGKLAQMPTAADVGAEPKLIVGDYSNKIVSITGFKSNLIIKKIGKMVIVNGYIEKTSGGSFTLDGVIAANLPESITPDVAVYGSGAAYNFAGGTWGIRYIINSNTRLIVYAPANATIVTIDIVYVV